jgi:hypothetical protein
LHRYDATSLSRFSLWLSVRPGDGGHLFFRRDRAEHVRWERGLGAVVDVTGARHMLAMSGGDDEDVEDDAIALPYAPGRATLALGGERTRDTVARYKHIDDFVDPLSPGAEEFYRYTAGDSETIRVPGPAGQQRVLHLREVQLHPRRPQWNISVGSLWFDLANGHLVRAVYRFGAPMDVVAVAKESDPHAFDEVPFWVRPLITPIVASLTAVTIEYRLVRGRFWLPVSRYAEGSARVNSFRVPVRWQVRYEYNSVNGPDAWPELAALKPPPRDSGPKPSAPAPPVAPGATAPPPTPAAVAATATSPAPPVKPETAREAKPHGSRHVNMRTGASQQEQSDSTERQRRKDQCKQQSTWDHVEVHDDSIRVLVRTPCDTVALARAPMLPKSIFDNGDAVFGTADAQEVLTRLSAAPPPDWSPQPPRLHYGLEDALIRYNRIEGPSVGLAVTQELGLGLEARAEGRLGFADLVPNGELRLTRSSPVGNIGIGVYHRLDSVNDWGDPFTVGSSLMNFLFGDDEGFYYRSWGAELSGADSAGALPFSWRLFVEHDWGATVQTRFSVTGAAGGAHMPAHNVVATPGTINGLGFRSRPTWGTDPDGWQLSADIRGEGAGGTYSYVRGATDLTVEHPVARVADAALTFGAGTSAGDVPAQRLWYLGGLRTIRGLAPGTESGDAYWMGHIEIGAHTHGVRPLAFYDLGWAGDRTAWTQQGRPASGVGVGLSILDGMLRFDVARGIYPTSGVRINAYWAGRL